MTITVAQAYQSELFSIILTGGIASGKSAAADYFAEFNIPIIDTDQLARDAVSPGSQGLSHIVDLFGQKILNKTGQLKRRKLREIIFNDEHLRKQLEALLHPLIEQAAIRQLQTLAHQTQPPSYVIIAVPLYVETQSFRWANRVLVIDVSSQTQLQRLQARDHIDTNLAQQMLHAQASREQRLAVADDVIVNEGTLNELQQACLQLHQQYLHQLIA